jgi:hypothetical protein
MLERQSAYDALIDRTVVPQISARTLRGSEVLACLRERLHQANPNDADDCEQEDFDERFTFEKSRTAPSLNRHDEECATPDHGLEDVKARLDELCCEECTSCLTRLLADEEMEDGEKYRQAAATLQADEPGMNTSILERIRNDEGTRDKVLDDLVAPLRSESLPRGIEESEEDMLNVMLDWNRRIAINRSSDSTERQAFVAALRERIKVVDKVMAIVSDKRNSNQDNETGQKGILEPSQRQLLKAMHAYRPETVGFKNQDPFDLLIIMLVHIRQEEFEIANRDDGVYLALKVLSGQGQLEHRFDHEKERRKYQKQKKDAKEDGSSDELRRCETMWRAYNKKLAKEARQGLMAKVQCARNELRKVSTDDLLKLAVLRSAQPRADREAPPDFYSPSREQILNICAQADDYDNLHNEFGEHFPHLEAKLEVTANNARDMNTVHDMVLFRMVKLAGADLRGLDTKEREKLMTARLNDPVTARVIEETLEGVTDTRRAAKQMLEHLGLIGQPMRELLDAVTSKRDDLAELTRLTNREKSPDSSSEMQEEEE